MIYIVVKTSFPALAAWFENLSSQKAFSDAVATVTDGKGVEAFKVLKQSLFLFLQNRHLKSKSLL